MKTFELKKKSWHYWLANFGDARIYDEVTDICSYIRCVIWGAFWLLVAAGAGAFFSGSILFAIGNLFSWLFLGYELANMTVGVFTVLTTVFLIFLALVSKEAIAEKMSKAEPGFVRLAYRSWKDKFCARIILK